MKKNKMIWLLLAVCAVNLLAHLHFYPALPETVATHWGADGTANGWSSKQSTLILDIMPAILVVLMAIIPKIDPKHQNFERFGKVWNVAVVGITLFMIAMTWLTELTTFDLMPDSSNIVGILVGGGLGILFILLGNYMPKIKQNYTFGCRTPWALNDGHNWNRTQRMGGITFIVVGVTLLASALLAKLLGDMGTMVLILVAVLGGTVWIYLYSYLVYIGKMK